MESNSKSSMIDDTSMDDKLQMKTVLESIHESTLVRPTMLPSVYYK
jgi:hypothetical protein